MGYESAGHLTALPGQWTGRGELPTILIYRFFFLILINPDFCCRLLNASLNLKLFLSPSQGSYNAWRGTFPGPLLTCRDVRYILERGNIFLFTVDTSTKCLKIVVVIICFLFARCHVTSDQAHLQQGESNLITACLFQHQLITADYSKYWGGELWGFFILFIFHCYLFIIFILLSYSFYLFGILANYS